MIVEGQPWMEQATVTHALPATGAGDVALLILFGVAGLTVGFMLVYLARQDQP